MTDEELLQAMRNIGRAAGYMAAQLESRFVIDGICAEKGFLFAHTNSTSPYHMSVLVVSVLVDGHDDPAMTRRYLELTGALRSMRPMGVHFDIEHHHVTDQQLEALQALSRMVGTDQACAQIFGFGATYIRKIVVEGDDAREENDEEFRARIVRERQGTL